MKRKWIQIIFCVILAAVFCGCKSGTTSHQEESVKTDNTANNGTVYTAQDIYIYSFECGYLSRHQNLRYKLVMAQSDEQFYDMKKMFSACDGEVDEAFHECMDEEFKKLENQYPIEEYTYCFCYDEVSSGGYYLHADKVQIKDGIIGFLMDDESYSPGVYDVTNDVMGGFFHLAAIPKTNLANMTFKNAVFPDEIKD